MPSCKLTILDEVNIKFSGLPIEIRRKLSNAFKYEIPYAKYQPAYRLGRWDGSVTLFGTGGNGYLSQLPRILAILDDCNVEVSEIEDLRKPVKIDLTPVTETYWADQGKVWPKGHPAEGQPIMLRDYQVEGINNFISNPQSLQSLPTGSGKTILTATLAHMCESLGRTITIVPNKSLVEQTEEDFVNVGLDVGVYYGDRKDLGKTHTICTWQSLNILDKKSKNSEQEILTLAEFLDGVSAVIVDECFARDTLILTPSGEIPIHQLKVGDKVINFDEQTKTYKEDIIVNVHKNLTHSSSEQMLKLTFDNNVEIEVTANHKFLTNIGWVRADQLTEDLEVIDINTFKIEDI